jgi:protoporphyrinogen oxidase
LTADVLILGAGPAGLGAAYRAARSGRKVVVLERGETVGGASASHSVGGVRVDMGSHRLHPSIEPRILEDLRALLGDELQRRPRNGRIRIAGRWIAFPLGATDLLKHLPFSFSSRVVLDMATSFSRKPKRDSFGEVLRAGLGPTICERFYFPYARKIWGLDPERLSGEQARRRVSASTPTAILKRVIKGSGGGGAEGAAYFWYPAGGYGRISEVLADAAVAAGADLRLGVTAEAIDLSGSRVTVSTSGEELEADRVWSTIPLPALVRAIIPGAPGPVIEAAKSLRTRAMTLVYLVLEGDRYTSFDAHYLPESWTSVTRISEPKNYREAEEAPGVTVLCAEIPCDVGDDHWNADRDALKEEVVDALVKAGLPAPVVTVVEVKRLPNAYPIYEDGYEAAFATVDEWVNGFENVLTFGRQGLFAHDNAHHALAMAWAAADLLEGDDFDRSGWGRARERFKEHVVED